MHPTRSAQVHQQRHIRNHAGNSDSYEFFNMLTSPELLDQVENLLPDHRERLYPPTETLSMFLAQALSADRSCQRAVNDAAIKRLTGGMTPCSTHTGAYCRARQRLPVEMVSTLVRKSGQLTAETTPDAWQWRGRPVRLVDGTTISMPDTAANQASYPQSRSQKPGLGNPLCRMAGIVCLGSGVLLDAAMGRYRGKGGDEQSLLRSMLDTLNYGDILLGDAYYATYFMLCDLQQRGVDAVFEQYGARKRSTDFRCGKRLGQRDHLIEISKPKLKPGWMTKEDYDQAPDILMVRELQTGGKILVTTLLCAKNAPKAALKLLYRSRWHVELDLRNIKATLGLGVLSCKTPAMAEKEIWVYLLAYNLIRMIMVQAAIHTQQLPRELSFKHSVQLWLAWGRKGAAFNHGADPSILLVLIAQQRVGKRPGRVEPRALKRRPKPFPLLNLPRQLARQRVLEHGHPKNVK
jgi:hypothetical protein